MASELRVNQITSTTGLGTVTFDAAGGVTFVASPTFTGTPTFTNINTTSINTGSISGTRNRVTNGSMRIDQRYGGQLVNPITASGYSIDQWIIAIAGTYSVRTQGNLNSTTPPVGFTSYFGVQNNNVATPTGTDNLHIQHRVEGHNMSDFSWGTTNAKTVTLSFWVQSSLVGTYGGCLRNSANDRSYVYEYRINEANTWEYKTITIPGDTTGTWLTANNVGIRIIWGLSAGPSSQGTANQWSASNFTNSTNGSNWAATANARFYLTGVQLEVGSRATEFERINYGAELRLCQRYLHVYPVSTIYAANRYPNVSLSSGTQVPTFLFPVEMRATPSPSPSTMSVSIDTWSASGGTTRIMDFQSVSSKCFGFSYLSTSNSGTNLAVGYFGWSNTATQTFSAEL